MQQSFNIFIYSGYTKCYYFCTLYCVCTTTEGHQWYVECTQVSEKLEMWVEPEKNLIQLNPEGGEKVWVNKKELVFVTIVGD